ncbi:Gaa1-like protein [Mycena floridula]|nr:Gaa1-like protein [Mycena floridula]
MDRLRALFRRPADPNLQRLQRRKRLFTLIDRRLPLIKLALFVVGYLWMLALPYPDLGRGTFIDENALQPGQVNTNWNWGDVQNADRYLDQLERLREENSTSDQRAEFLTTEFRKLGIAAATQRYSFSSVSKVVNGTNAYAVISSPRSSGAEAMVISASWRSRAGEGALNLRGVATVLALAKFLKNFSYWAKDIVLVISDGHLDGMQAWLSEYHGATQSNLVADRIELPSGVIWTALNLDYPGHSFSHLGIFYEGLNGRLPNQDLVNSFHWISKYTGGVPLLVYDNLDPREHPGRRDELDILPTWLPSSIRDNSDVRAYGYQAKNVLHHVGYQATGRGSGVHGLFHQYRIDAFTMFAVPATGPHGFHAIGRIIESTLRTANNLLERLHASFFFYILSGPQRFIQIGNFLPSAVLVSVAMMFTGLKIWHDAAWTLVVSEKSQWIPNKRPVLGALSIMTLTHLFGLLLFSFVTSTWFNSVVLRYIMLLMVYATPFALLLVVPQDTKMLSRVLKAFNLCFASTVISTTTVLNFSLAASLAVVLGVPLSISAPSTSAIRRMAAYTFFFFLGFGWLVVAPEQTRQVIWDWEILGVWFAPFVCIVFCPLVLQASMVCILP